MKSPKRPITSMQVRNFKAVKDTGLLKPDGLTVFIGDNGVGKSSVLEALRFMAALSRETLDDALEPFKGYEHVRWKGGEKRGRVVPGAALQEFHPLSVTAQGYVGEVRVRATTRLTGQNNNDVMFEHEELRVGAELHTREIYADRAGPPTPRDRSILSRTSWFDDWSFLDMVPGRMGSPTKRTRAGGAVRLSPDGNNLAEYLLSLRSVPERGGDAFNGLLETLQVILPYARELVPEEREVFGPREVALQLHEGSFTVPGWMLSTGTLRLVALLALLRHPKPPSLLCVEEIENGLDPRTIQLVVNELVNAADSGRTQIMVTTHSPYLLDLVPLKSLVLVERKAGSTPTFDQPEHHEEVRGWAESFTPGRLYTMGTFRDRRRDK
jgi:predicted ATPase